MILKIFNLKRGNRDRKTSDTSFMKKNMNKYNYRSKGIWTQGHCQYRDLLSHAHYRDPYFDFMYFSDQLFVSI